MNVQDIFGTPLYYAAQPNPFTVLSQYEREPPDQFPGIIQVESFYPRSIFCGAYRSALHFVQ